MNTLDKITSIKILRPITLPIIGACMVLYIIADYVFNIEE